MLQIQTTTVGLSLVWCSCGTLCAILVYLLLCNLTKAPVVHVKSKDTKKSKGGKQLNKNVETRAAGGLLKDLYLCVGMKVTVTDNLWTQMGLVNGTTGKVVGMCYDRHVDGEMLTSDATPSIVLVELDNMYTCTHGLTPNPSVVPIVMTHRNFWVGKVNVRREQFPLQPAFALTIHKAQGLTSGPRERVTHLTVDIGMRDWAAGLAYVALSRAQLMSAIALDPLHSFEERWKRLGSTRNCIEIRTWVGLLEMWALMQIKHDI